MSLQRELKDSTHWPTEGGQPARKVNLVFRIRHKFSEYVWIECTGRLHVEPRKGRKAVILSWRTRNLPSRGARNDAILAVRIRDTPLCERSCDQQVVVPCTTLLLPLAAFGNVGDSRYILLARGSRSFQSSDAHKAPFQLSVELTGKCLPVVRH